MKQPVGLLSGGQRQALTLLMATLVPPKLLLLDEHTAALDPSTAEKVLSLTREIVAEHHITTMMVTHNMKKCSGAGQPHSDDGQWKGRAGHWGEERKGLTVEDLLKRFKAGAGRGAGQRPHPALGIKGRAPPRRDQRRAALYSDPGEEQPGHAPAQGEAAREGEHPSEGRWSGPPTSRSGGLRCSPHPAGQRCGCGWCSPEGPAGWPAADSRRRPDRRPAPPGDPDAPSRGPRCR